MKIHVTAYRGLIVIEPIGDITEGKGVDWFPTEGNNIGCSISNAKRDLFITRDAVDLMKKVKRNRDAIGDIMGEGDSFSWIGGIYRFIDPVTSEAPRDFNINKINYNTLDVEISDEVKRMVDNAYSQGDCMWGYPYSFNKQDKFHRRVVAFYGDTEIISKLVDKKVTVWNLYITEEYRNETIINACEAFYVSAEKLKKKTDSLEKLLEYCSLNHVPVFSIDNKLKLKYLKLKKPIHAMDDKDVRAIAKVFNVEALNIDREDDPDEGDAIIVYSSWNGMPKMIIGKDGYVRTGLFADRIFIKMYDLIEKIGPGTNEEHMKKFDSAKREKSILNEKQSSINHIISKYELNGKRKEDKGEMSLSLPQ